MVSGSASLVEVTRSQPSSAVIGEQIASLPVLERNFLSLAQLMPGAAPDQRPNRFSITKFGGAADQRNCVHHDHRRRRHRRRASRATRRSTCRRTRVQEFKVFRNQFDAQYGNALSAGGGGGLEVGHQPVARHRLLLRPRRRAERQERLRAGPSPSDQQGRVGGSARRSAAPQPHASSSRTYEYNDVDTTCGSSPCRPAIRSPPPRTARSPRAAPITSSTPSSTTGSTTGTRCSSATRSTISSSSATATPPRTRARATTSAPRTAWSAEGTSILSPRLVNSLRVHFLTQNVGTLTHSTAAGETRPSIATGPAPTWPQDFPAHQKTTVGEALYYNTARHDIKLGRRLLLLQRQLRVARQRDRPVHLHYRPAVRCEHPGHLADLAGDADARPAIRSRRARSRCTPRTTGGLPTASG